MISLGRLLMFLICVNIACWFICQVVPIIGVPAPVGFNIQAEYDKVQQLANSIPATNPASLVAVAFGYIWFAMTTLWTLLSWTVAGFPILLASLGAPTVISLPLGLIWSFLIVLGLIELVGGREVT